MPTRKIVLITVDYPPERGGVARYLHSLVEESHGQMQVIVAGAFFRKAWPMWWPLISLCRKQTDAVLLISHVFPVGTAAWISRLLGGPEYVIVFHGLDLRRAQGAWKRFLLRLICRSAKRLIVNSRATGKDLRRLVPGASYEIITPGVDVRERMSKKDARQALDLDPEKQLVVSLARLVSRKGIDIALRAMAEVQKEGDVDYVVVGDGPDRDRLESLAAKSGVTARWVTNADEEEKWQWLAAADVFLLPVRDEGKDVEGFGIVFLEAASVGVPSVAGKSGGAEEAVVDGTTGILVHPLSFEDTQKAVMLLLRDESLRERLGEAAKKRAKADFRWSERWDKLKHILA